MISFLRNLILKDFSLKLFSLVLAMGIWFTINSAIQNQGSPVPVPTLGLSSRETRTFANLPVMVVSSAEDVHNFRVNPKEVEVTVQGDPKTVDSLRSSDIRVIVDLTGIAAGHDLRKRIEVSTPASVTHLRVEPDEVQVVFPHKE